MHNREKVDSLRQKIYESLSLLIDNDYIYMDLPYHQNIGDSLIWQGTEDFLSILPYKCLYRCSFYTCEFPEISKDVVILLHGGGNFGNLYRNHCKFRNAVIQRYPENKIIILPQSVYYDDYRYVRYDASIMNRHNNLFICARDTYSFNFLKKHKFCSNVLLVPDMAFCIDLNKIEINQESTSEKRLIIQRVDKEKTDMKNLVLSYDNQEIDITDWPLYAEVDDRLKKLRCLISNRKNNEANEYAVYYYLPERVKDGIGMISPYQYIYSNRLHGAILSVILGKTVNIFDNSYGKNMNFYNTWLTDDDDVKITSVKGKLSIKHKLKSLISRLPLFKCPEAN